MRMKNVRLLVIQTNKDKLRTEGGTTLVTSFASDRSAFVGQVLPLIANLLRQKQPLCITYSQVLLRLFLSTNDFVTHQWL